MLAFIGGLSAGTAMVIVVCVALSTMISNDLLMPLLMRMRSLRLQQNADLSAWVLGCKRVSIALLAALARFYRSTVAAALASYGLLAFSAVARISPRRWSPRCTGAMPVSAAWFGTPGRRFRGLDLHPAAAAAVAGRLVGGEFLQKARGDLHRWRRRHCWAWRARSLTHGALWSLLVNSALLMAVSLR